MSTEMPKSALEGGFIQVATKPGRKAVYRGTVRTRTDKKIQWQCKHVHSRPEYNARYQGDEDLVWEASALNCGRTAHDQWPNPIGFNGLVGDTKMRVEERDDARYARVEDEHYLGRVSLHEDGARVLRVSQTTGGQWTGHIDLDAPIAKGLHLPPTTGEPLAKWVTAAWLLKGGVWGIVFQDPRVRMEAPTVIPRAIEELLGDRKEMAKDDFSRLALPRRKQREAARKRVRTSASPPATSPESEPAPAPVQPHIQVARRGGKRVFEVIDAHGRVVDTHVHRGKAVESLAKVKKTSLTHGGPAA